MQLTENIARITFRSHIKNKYRQKTKLKNAAYKVDEVDDALFLLARDADGVEAMTAEVQAKVDDGEARL